MRHHIICQLCAGVLGFVALTGCGSVESGSTDGNHANADAHDHSHEHGEEGPHGGHLIELGRNHEYHAELVDEHGSVTIYILDAHMDEVAIDDSVITLNLRAGEQNASHELTTATPGGQSHSRFVSSEASLLSAFESDAGVSGKLRVTIKGVPYVGDIAHHGHDHEGHAHGDGGEHDDDHGHVAGHDDETTHRH